MFLHILKQKRFSGGDCTDSHSYTFEQYCGVVGRNVIVEETTFFNGERQLRCLSRHICGSDVCRNAFLRKRFEKTVEKRR